MKQKSKFGKRLLSVILSATVIASAAFSLSLPVSAASGQARGSVPYSGIGDANWSTYSGNYKFVMAIRASSITDDTPASDFVDEEVRYGNGVSDQMYDYPLFMQLSVTHLRDNNKYRGNAEYNSNDAEQSKTRSKLYKDINKEYDNLKGDDDWRKSHSNEFIGYDDVSYSGRDGIKNYVGQKIGKNKKSVYLEDVLGYVLTGYEDGTFSYYDVRNFWFFYTRFAYGANQDWGFNNTNNTSDDGLGDKLNQVFITAGTAVQKEAYRMKMIQSGYMVALYACYGVKPYKYMSDKSSFQQSDSSLNNTLWSPDSSNRYKSFVVDKLVTYIVNNNNSFITTSTLMSVTDYAHLCSIANRLNPNCGGNYMKEYLAIYPQPTGSGGVSSIWYSLFRTIVRHLYPKSGKDGTERKVNGVSTYAGWGYYEVTDGSVDDPPPYKPYYPSKKQIATEVTYNANLATSENDNYWEEIGNQHNPDNIDAFANNGHVMSDTVYLSEPADILAVARSFADYTQLVDNHPYMTTTVDRTIKLSAPVETTTYNLKDLYYRITVASGTEVGGSALVEYNPTGAVSNRIGILGRDITSALNNSNASYAVRKHVPVTDKGVQRGKSTGGYYYVYKYQNGSLVNQKTGDGKLYTTGGYKKADGTVNCTSNLSDYFSNKTYSGHETDYNEKSTNFWYINFGGNIIPAVYENNTWYLCPVIKITNLLVQIRADYTADFGKGTSNYENTYKSTDMPEYLLTQNNSSNDFTRKTLVSMIDCYTMNQWGSLVHKSYAYQLNDGIYGSVKLSDSNSYTYWLASLRQYNKKGLTFDDGWSEDAYETDTSNRITDARKKVQYVTEVQPTSPSFVEGTEVENENYNLTTNNTFVNSNLGVNVRRFTINGKSATQISSSLSKTGDLKYTDFTSSANSRHKLKKINGIGSKYQWFDIWDDNIPKYPSEGFLIAKSPLGIDLTKLGYKTNRKNTVVNTSTTTNSVVKGYTQDYFTKILATYKKMIYTKRGVMASAKTPNIAEWKYKQDVLKDQKDSHGNVTSQGLTSKYAASASVKGKNLGSAQSVYAGFYRFGQTTMVLYDKDGVEHRIFRRLLNNANKPDGFQAISIESNVSSNVMKGWMFSGTDLNLAEPFTQSNFDIPLNYNIKVHTAIDKPIRDTGDPTYTVSGGTLKQTYQYEETKPWTGIFKTSGSNKVSLGVYPEVLMFAENDRTSGSSLTYSSVITVGAKERYIPAMTYAKANFNDLSIKAQVTGTAVAFDTRAKALAKSLGSKDVQVLYSGSGLKMAFKTNAAGTVKSYALDFTGSVTSSSNNIARGTNGWGNGNYYTINAATAATKNLVNELSATSKKELAVYNSDKNTLTQIPVGSESTLSLSASAPTYTNTYYNLVIRNGQITSVQEKSKDGNTYSVVSNYKVSGSNVTSSDGGNTEKLKEILEGMRLIGSDSVLSASFENGTGVALPKNKSDGSETASSKALREWAAANNSKFNDRYTKGGKSYYEDCTTLQIKEYTANITTGGNSTATEQLPLTLGPQTQADKNKYFSDGYKGFVMASLEIKGKSTAPESIRDKVVAKASTKHTDKNNSSTKYDLTSGTQAQKNSWASNAIPDFIIADVTINEATTY